MNRRHFLGNAGALTAATLAAPARAFGSKDAPMHLAQAATRTPDVIYVPTPQEVVDTMLSLAKPTKNDLVYDLGCGDGRIVITAAKQFGARGVGVDIDPQRISEANANVKAENVGDRVRIIQGDLFEIDFKDATIVTLYLLPSLNLKLRPKLWRELKPGTRVVSHDFDMGDWVPEQKVSVASRTVYFWRITGKNG
ncbi:MAG: SAM-dependent methyltransferase [Burkholderiales bacterium]